MTRPDTTACSLVQSEESWAGKRGATARPAQAVPREIMDVAMDEILDVIQDNEPDLPPVSNLQEPEDLTQRRVRRAP